MTSTALIEFREKVNANTELQAEVLTAFMAGGEGIVGVGKKYGYSFTKEEALSLLASGQGELNDFELELVSGGNSPDCSTNTGNRDR